MLKLIYHQDICHLEVMSDLWVRKILKYARLMLTSEQNRTLTQSKFVATRVVVGPCSDGHQYTCYMRLLTAGSKMTPYFSYCEGIGPQTWASAQAPQPIQPSHLPKPPQPSEWQDQCGSNRIHY